MRFKYLYEHLHCGFCSEIESEGCPHTYCPHILENIKDLLCDPAFIEAIELADECSTYHRPTLLLIQDIREKERASHFDPIESKEPVDGVFCTFKPECCGCPYPRHGYLCYNERSGHCLKNDVDAIMRKGKSCACHN